MDVRLASLLVGIAALGGAPAAAHHSTEVFYDHTKTLEFVAVLQRVDMINPHIWLHFRSLNSDGSARVWRIEADHPSLIRRGMLAQFGREVEFESGQSYTVRVEPAWNTHDADGYLKSIVFPNGSTFTCC